MEIIGCATKHTEGKVICTGIEIAAGIGAASSAFGALTGASAAKQQQAAYLQQGYYQREMNEYNAELIRQSSKQQAERVIESALRLRGQQQVTQAAQGVVIGEGSAAAIVQDSFNLASRDALITLYEGIDGQLTELNEGEMALRSAKAQAAAAGQQAVASLLSGAAGIASSYSTYKGLTAKRTG